MLFSSECGSRIVALNREFDLTLFAAKAQQLVNHVAHIRHGDADDSVDYVSMGCLAFTTTLAALAKTATTGWQPCGEHWSFASTCGNVVVDCNDRLTQHREEHGVIVLNVESDLNMFVSNEVGLRICS
ncbi:unnamed protein product [Sphenostylis stenocarpa]|uniref:Uncharacterized protein n=1 Tax=Sphenostylis stenocarpa TaxID=92480 RepID=A0AA86T9U6_9FABA|nr:unnamed protein product [Sphenostylis stenocarpa]